MGAAGLTKKDRLGISAGHIGADLQKGLEWMFAGQASLGGFQHRWEQADEAFKKGGWSASLFIYTAVWKITPSAFSVY